MTPDTRGYTILDQLRLDSTEERRLLVAGLRTTPATLEPKYFYDELGCALYAAICRLDEYYPTRTEQAIFQQYRSEITVAIKGASGPVSTFIDLGAGDCCKAQSWLAFIQPQRYLAVDVAGDSIRNALEKMVPEFPDIQLSGLVTDFSAKLEVPSELIVGAATLFYPGSSIGNFAPDDAVRFLKQIRTIASGGLLIGVDAKKGTAVLDAAYADALGVTAAFNLNVLRHLNRLIGSDFDCADWKHRGFYNAALGRVEMHLEAKRTLIVTLEGQPRHFAVGESIHTENSYKYHRDEFESLLRAAGFGESQCWTNDEQSFWVFYAR
jgi:dimethylhistidine N-methyltransferase